MSLSQSLQASHCRDPLPASRDACSPEDEEDGWPAATGRSLVPFRSCSKPKSRLPLREKAQQNQGLGCRSAHSWQLSPDGGNSQAGGPGTLSRNEFFHRRARSRSTHTALGSLSAVKPQEGRCGEIRCVQRCAEHRSRVSAATGSSTLHRGCSLLAAAQDPSGDPSVTDLALAQGSCHRPCC